MQPACKEVDTTKTYNVGSLGLQFLQEDVEAVRLTADGMTRLFVLREAASSPIHAVLTDVHVLLANSFGAALHNTYMLYVTESETNCHCP